MFSWFEVSQQIVKMVYTHPGVRMDTSSTFSDSLKKLFSRVFYGLLSPQGTGDVSSSRSSSDDADVRSVPR